MPIREVNANLSLLFHYSALYSRSCPQVVSRLIELVMIAMHAPYINFIYDTMYILYVGAPMCVGMDLGISYYPGSSANICLMARGSG